VARYAYVNGRYVPHGDAAVHIEDRGFQFADGVYEVVPILGDCMVDAAPHLDRLERSLSEMKIGMPVSRKVLELVMRELIDRNGVANGLIYMQITRGVAPRDHKFPSGIRPSIVMTTKHVRFLTQKKISEGVKVITIPDIRWTRCDIKTVALLPNCMGKSEAAAAGAYEAWQVDREGFVTEGTSTNAWMVTNDNKLLTRPVGHEILRGVTRQSLLRIALEEGLSFEETAFTVAEAKAAREAFVSSATSFVTPVVAIDDVTIGDGTPGPLSRRLQGWYLDYCEGLKNSA
jgi:D-alanine transaminase